MNTPLAYVASTVVVMAKPPATRLLLFYCARADRRIRAAEAVVDACPGAPGNRVPAGNSSTLLIDGKPRTSVMSRKYIL